ncbi:MAG: hypothetical protein ACFCBW_11825 [Candidatus Competibacterales bacterium]
MPIQKAVLILALSFLPTVHAFDLLKETEELGKSAGEIVDRQVKDAEDTVDTVVGNKKAAPQAERAAIDKMAGGSLNKLFSQDTGAKQAFEKSYGYAVFDSEASSFGFTTTGDGRGVAIKRNADYRTYMKMFSAGVDVGVGIQYFQMIFLFPNEATFNNFVEVGWDADADVTGAAGKDGESKHVVLANGVSVYKLNENGIMLDASLTGTKYFQSKELNAGR